MTAIAVTIAGSDSGGGAGIQADLKTFSALGVYGASVITALTAQNTCGVSAIQDVPPAFIRAQIDAVFSDLDVSAVKIGMLSQPAVIEAVADGLVAHDVSKVILDPVMVAASGDPLLAKEAVSVLRQVLMPKAMLVTPNLHEAAILTGKDVATSDDEMREQAYLLCDAGAKAVLMKGGHSEGDEARDLLLHNEFETWVSSPRYPSNNTHGTGCTLSSAITSSVAKGVSLEEAVKIAKAYIAEAIRRSDELTIGKGHGPVHHFHAQWT